MVGCVVGEVVGLVVGDVVGLVVGEVVAVGVPLTVTVPLLVDTAMAVAPGSDASTWLKVILDVP